MSNQFFQPIEPVHVDHAIAAVGRLLPIMRDSQRLLDLQFEGNEPSTDEILVALYTEFGEVLQALKPAWAWWKRKDKVFEYGDVLDELADMLHFWLSYLNTTDLVGDAALLGYSVRSYYHTYRWHIENAGSPLPALAVRASRDIPDLGFALAVANFRLADLVGAYYKKAALNLARWGGEERLPALLDLRDQAYEAIGLDKPKRGE